MELEDSFTADDNQSNSSGPSRMTTPIPKDNADKKLTLEEEADLTPHEIAQMEKQLSEQAYKGSSGPEEKDITA